MKTLYAHLSIVRPDGATWSIGLTFQAPDIASGAYLLEAFRAGVRLASSAITTSIEDLSTSKTRGRTYYPFHEIDAFKVEMYEFLARNPTKPDVYYD